MKKLPEITSGAKLFDFANVEYLISTQTGLF